MIIIKIFNRNIDIDNNNNLLFLDNSKIDGYPYCGVNVFSLNEKIIFDIFLDYSKLLLYLRIFKLKNINKSITKNELKDLNLFEFLKDNYNKITIIDKM